MRNWLTLCKLSRRGPGNRPGEGTPLRTRRCERSRRQPRLDNAQRTASLVVETCGTQRLPVAVDVTSRKDYSA